MLNPSRRLAGSVDSNQEKFYPNVPGDTECLGFCNGYLTFDCKSFDYSSSLRQCKLYAFDRGGGSALETASGWDHYNARYCPGPGKLARDLTLRLSVNPGSETLGTNAF